MKRFLVSGALALVTASACGAPAPAPEVTASSTSDIQGGTSDTTTHDFAVGIAIDLGGGEAAVCSGALIAPNLVATARHCAAQLSADQIDCSSSTFGSPFAPSQYLVTNGLVLGQGASYAVSKVVAPTGANQTGVCGNDIALLILSTNIEIPEYVQPVLNPPMTSSMWATTVTAIGYGIDSPTDTVGASAGTRRIRENIGLVCIPDDTSFVDCYSDPTAKQYILPSEFESGDGTCEGDSGSSAYDQVQFNKGKWFSFGVLSRGGVSSDGQTCVGSIYSRFDAWSQLIVDTANEAAKMGGYTAPAWTTAAAVDAGSKAASAEGGSGAGADGTVCAAPDACTSQNCVSLDGAHFFCASPCGTGNSCAAGTVCEGGYCFSAATAATIPSTGTSTTTIKKSGCAVAMVGFDSTHPVPWSVTALGLVMVGLAIRRRQRR
jgi:V8-like Glu-specific endopeptidase